MSRNNSVEPSQKENSRAALWLALGAGVLGLWSQRYRLRGGRFSRPGRSERPGKALVTGASSGIGAAFARELAARGYDLVLVARRGGRLQDLADELIARCGVTVDTVPADLSHVEDFPLVERVITAQRQVDILVNNAGFDAPGPLAETDRVQQLDMVRLHDLAAVSLTRAVLPGMIARRYGSIINTASTASFFPLPRHAVYSASKAFLVTFSEALQMEVENSNVYIQALCPGFTYTNNEENSIDRSLLPSLLWMRAEDVARQSLNALGSGEVIFIPGQVNRLIASLGRSMLTRGMVLWGLKNLTQGSL